MILIDCDLCHDAPGVEWHDDVWICEACDERLEDQDLARAVFGEEWWL